MQGRIGGSKDLPALMRGAALPIGHDATRGFYDSNRSLHIIGLQTRLDHQIDLSCRDKGIGIAICAIAHQAAVLRHTFESRSLSGRSDFGESGEQDRL